MFCEGTLMTTELTVFLILDQPKATVHLWDLIRQSDNIWKLAGDSEAASTYWQH